MVCMTAVFRLLVLSTEVRSRCRLLLGLGEYIFLVLVVCSLALFG